MPLRVQYLPGMHARKHVGNVLQCDHLDVPGLRRAEWFWQPVRIIFSEGEKIMADKIISIEQQDGPFQKAFQRVMRMVPDRDKQDKKLQRLIAFRLRVDGEAALSEYLIKKIKTAIKCSYSGSMYDYLKDDMVAKECEDPDADEPPPGVA
jgi:hypothetical protein